MAEPVRKKNKEDKKKKFWKYRQNHSEWKEQTLATGVNTTKASKKNLKVKYFNYDKKSYYANNCIKSSKN